MFGDLAELLELAGFEEEVGFGEKVVVADISEAFADKAEAGDVSLLPSTRQLVEDHVYDLVGEMVKWECGGSSSS